MIPSFALRSINWAVPVFLRASATMRVEKKMGPGGRG